MDDSNARVRALVEEGIGRIVEGERADRALERVLRANRDLTSDERRRVATWTLGLALWRGRIDRLCGGNRALWLAVFLAEREGLAPGEAAQKAGVRAADVASALSRQVQTTSPADRLAFECSLPLWLAERWIAQLGEARAHRLAAAMNQRGPVALRANTLRTSRDALLESLAVEGVSARASSISPLGVVVLGRANLFGFAAWRGGLFEVQDEGSQLIAEAVQARPGQTVVDLCAGAGGKTLALAAAMGDRGRVVAIDVEAKRLGDLSVRLRRSGVACVETRQGDGRDEAVWRDLEGRADRVLVDAPCSELGVLRRGPDSRWRIAPDAPERFSILQRQLCEAAARLVAPGGRLVYATCSVDPAENERVADDMEAWPDFEPLERRHTWPDVEGCDGFFWAVFRRRPV